MTEKMLTTRNAQITTATVAIHTLTVSGKQVTLAVFRQLLEKPLIDDDGDFLGLPWGTVNYHPDKGDPGGDGHLHAVWQDGEALRRAVVNEPCPPGGWRPYRSTLVTECAHSVYCARGHDLSQLGQQTEDGGVVRFTVFGMTCATYAPTVVNRQCRFRGDGSSPAVKAHPDVYACAPMPDTAALQAEIAAEQERRESLDRCSVRHCERWAELQALPQLFIAV